MRQEHSGRENYLAKPYCHQSGPDWPRNWTQAFLAERTEGGLKREPARTHLDFGEVYRPHYGEVELKHAVWIKGNLRHVQL